jgi:hypothetical protein
MHDCFKTKEQLLDLVFDELEPDARDRALVELDDCRECLAQYLSLTETLHLFDQAAEATTPDERYWPGYEAGLRARLRGAQPGIGQRLSHRLKAWTAGFALPNLRPVPLAAGLALALLALGWLWGRPWLQGVTPPEIVRSDDQATPTPPPAIQSPHHTAPGPTPPSPAPKLADNSIGGRQAHSRTTGQKRRSASPLPIAPPAEPGAEIVAANTDMVRFARQFAGDSPLSPGTTRHFEKAQLLLRSVRNAGVGQGAEARAQVDLTYEKQLSRRLLYQNILLRREAEARGDLPAEGMLNDLEPFLLDIANLPGNPSTEDLRDIRERMRRKEMIAALQVYAVQPSLPVYQIQ